MDNSNANKLVKGGAKTSTDTNNRQERRVIAANGILRIQVAKGVNRGKATN